MHASPPTVNRTLRSWLAGSAAKAVGVNTAWDTSCWRMSSSNCSPGNAWSALGITAAAPVNSAVHMFDTDASKVNGANCRIRLSGVMTLRSRWVVTRPAIPVWVTATPLGTPVVPEV
ncbi:hypothetical protein MYBA111488_24850 [Mycobacterium basiliense]